MRSQTGDRIQELQEFRSCRIRERSFSSKNSETRLSRMALSQWLFGKSFARRGCILSQRDSMIVARHEVPGSAPPKTAVP
jgi:hypothetical protein